MQQSSLPPSYISAWPGKSAGSDGIAHPAVYHMLDVAAVSECLIRQPEVSRAQLFALLIALHDLGKIGNEFRDMLLTGKGQGWKHWKVTEAWLCDGKNDELPEKSIEGLLLMRLGGTWRVWRQLVAAIAGHHGGPPDALERDWTRMRTAAGPNAAADARAFVEICLALWPKASLQGISLDEAKTMSWLLSGLTVASDWIGSNPLWFPPTAPGLPPAHYLAQARVRAQAAVRRAGLVAPPLSDATLFDFTLRPMQRAAQDVALPDGPILAFIEDETGAGKTEAALILAQRMLLAGKAHGLYFALPTMATADAMFARIDAVIGRMFASAPSLTLAHGRSLLSQKFREVQARAPDSDDAVCGPWLADSRRKALLGDVGVGTIDQALLSVLPTRFSTLRNFGLSSKLLIVDEAHELGAPYLAHELATLLRFHAMQGGSAILMTATLPLAQRAVLSLAFEEGAGRMAARDDDPTYPSLSVSGGAAARAFPAADAPKGPVRVERLSEAAAAVALLACSARAGAACVWVRNAVDDAIAAVDALRAAGIDADLLHARFALIDRKRIEALILKRYGRQGIGRTGRVLVATQVVESSLDLDFDVMVSDLAPVAALIQRAGRLWRHMDIRPASARAVAAPVLYVLSPDPDEVTDARWLHGVLQGGAYVYPLPDQWRTADVLFRTGVITAPEGLRALVEAVHGAAVGDLPLVLQRAEDERHGAALAEGNLATRNVIKIDDGYRSGGGASDDSSYPTRLGEPQRTLLLAVATSDGLRPWADDGALDLSRADAEMLSEVSVRASRLRRLDLPDQSDPAILAFTRDWPDWKRDGITVCVVDAAGWICEGLYYQSKRGTIFGPSSAVSQVRSQPTQAG